MNPPIWANQAVPPAPVDVLFQICRPIHMSSKMMAGIRAMVQKNPRKIKVLIRGERKQYQISPEYS